MTTSNAEVRRQLVAIERAGEVSMSQREAAERLGWPLERLRAAVYTGRVPSAHISRAVRIPAAAVNDLAAVDARRAQRQASPASPESA